MKENVFIRALLERYELGKTVEGRLEWGKTGGRVNNEMVCAMV